MNLAQQTCCTPLENICHITPLLLHNGRLSTRATLFCPQDGRFREVPLYKWKRQIIQEMFVWAFLKSCNETTNQWAVF